MSGTKVRIIKLGGSLLTRSGTQQHLIRWLNNDDAYRNIWIAGGGKLVDAIRDWSHRFPIDDESAHWMSIECMSLTCSVLNKWLPDTPIVHRWQDLVQNPLNDLIFDIALWIREQKGIPTDWRITSDSLAAIVARKISADELVLLKSCLPTPEFRSLSNLADNGYVDRAFAEMAKGLRIRFVDLADDELAEQLYLPNS